MSLETALVDTKRCVVHVDVDAFYAQCEEIRNPSLRERPLGITQKYLLVTSNYPARRRGVTKLMGITEAQQKCPDLVLVSGEDLTPYRQASKRILTVLQRFGVCERGGMDEMLVDVTAEAQNRVLQGSAPSVWAAHVHSNKVALIQDNRHRPMDLRALALRGAITHVTTADQPIPVEVREPTGQPWESLLMAGCAIAQEMRAVLKAEVGFRCSAGIASNRMLAKLVSGLHKPDDQTVLLPPDAAAFVAPLPVRALPGVGFKMGNELNLMDIQTAADLRRVSQDKLKQKFGERIGTFLWLACRGQDPSPVQDKGPPKSITVEDSFKDCSSMAAAEHVIKVLAPDLLARMVEDFEETGRHASTLTLKWRHRGTGWGRASSSCPCPAPLHTPSLDNPTQVNLLGSTLVNMLKRSIVEPFQLTLLNIGVTNFTASRGSNNAWNPAFSKLLGPQAKKQKLAGPECAELPLNGALDSKSAALKSIVQRRNYGAQPTAACISKSIERALREQSRGQFQQGKGQFLAYALERPQSAPAADRLDGLDWDDEEDWEGDQLEAEEAQAGYSNAKHNDTADIHLSSVMPSQVIQTMLPASQASNHKATELQAAKSEVSQLGGTEQLPDMQAPVQQSLLQVSNTSQQQQQQQQLQQHQPPPPLQQRVQNEHLATSEHVNAHEQALFAEQSHAVLHIQAACSMPPEKQVACETSEAELAPTHQQPAEQRHAHEFGPTSLEPCNAQLNCLLDGANSSSRLSRRTGPDIHSSKEAIIADAAQLQTAESNTQQEIKPIADSKVLMTSRNATNADGVDRNGDAELLHSEQSDFELAMRLQAQEHAMQRTASRLALPSRTRKAQKARPSTQGTGTLHAFFKKA